jgi:hypothetical protein
MWKLYMRSAGMKRGYHFAFVEDGIVREVRTVLPLGWINGTPHGVTVGEALPKGEGWKEDKKGLRSRPLTQESLKAFSLV